MRRLGVDGGARLLVRHRLTQNARAEDARETARSLVALHSTDPATVFLSTWARSLDFRRRTLEEALYDERTLVRMLGMRRTLWVVALDLAGSSTPRAREPSRRASGRSSSGSSRRAASRTTPPAGSTGRPPPRSTR